MADSLDWGSIPTDYSSGLDMSGFYTPPSSDPFGPTTDSTFNPQSGADPNLGTGIGAIDQINYDANGNLPGAQNPANQLTQPEWDYLVSVGYAPAQLSQLGYAVTQGNGAGFTANAPDMGAGSVTDYNQLLNGQPGTSGGTGVTQTGSPIGINFSAGGTSTGGASAGGASNAAKTLTTNSTLGGAIGNALGLNTGAGSLWSQLFGTSANPGVLSSALAKYLSPDVTSLKQQADYLNSINERDKQVLAYNMQSADKRAGIGDELQRTAANYDPNTYGLNAETAAKNLGANTWQQELAAMHAQGASNEEINAAKMRSDLGTSQNAGTGYATGWNTGQTLRNSGLNAASGNYIQLAQPSAGLATAYSNLATQQANRQSTVGGLVGGLFGAPPAAGVQNTGGTSPNMGVNTSDTTPATSGTPTAGLNTTNAPSTAGDSTSNQTSPMTTGEQYLNQTAQTA